MIVKALVVYHLITTGLCAVVATQKIFCCTSTTGANKIKMTADLSVFSVTIMMNLIRDLFRCHV